MDQLIKYHQTDLTFLSKGKEFLSKLTKM